MMRVEFEFDRVRVESLIFRAELEFESSLLEQSSTRVVNISSRVRSRVELELESSSSSSRAYSSRVLIESSPSSSRVVSFH